MQFFPDIVEAKKTSENWETFRKFVQLVTVASLPNGTALGVRTTRSSDVHFDAVACCQNRKWWTREIKKCVGLL